GRWNPHPGPGHPAPAPPGQPGAAPRGRWPGHPPARAPGPSLPLGSQTLEYLPQVGGKRRLDLDGPAALGQAELQVARVQELAGDGDAERALAVHLIADDRVADEEHMHPDLVRASRLDLDVQEGGVAEPLQHAEVGHGRAAVGHYRHPLAVARVAADRRVDRAFVLADHPMDQGDVALDDIALLPLLDQITSRLLVLRDDDQARGVLVQAVYDPGPLPTHQERDVRAQRLHDVDERAVLVPRCRVGHQARGLVEDDDVVVLVDHRNRDVLGGQIVRLGDRREENLDGVALVDAARRSGRLSVDVHIPGLDERLRVATADLRHPGGNQAVESLSVLLGRHIQNDPDRILHQCFTHTRTYHSSHVASYQAGQWRRSPKTAQA